MYIYIMILIVCNNMIAMYVDSNIQERNSSSDITVQMHEALEDQGVQVHLDDDLDLDDHRHLIKHEYINALEGDSYYLTPKIRQKHAKKALCEFERNQPDLYRCIQNRRQSNRASAGTPVGNNPGVQGSVPLSVGVLQHEDPNAVPMDDLIEMAANGISHAVVRKDFTFLEHTITKEKTQKAVATIILGIVTIGLGILNGYLGNQTTSSECPFTNSTF